MRTTRDCSGICSAGTERDCRMVKQEYETYMTVTPCEVCHGKRLKPESLAVTSVDKNIADVTDPVCGALHDFSRN